MGSSPKKSKEQNPLPPLLREREIQLDLRSVTYMQLISKVDEQNKIRRYYKEVKVANDSVADWKKAMTPPRRDLLLTKLAHEEDEYRAELRKTLNKVKYNDFK